MKTKLSLIPLACLVFSSMSMSAHAQNETDPCSALAAAPADPGKNGPGVAYNQIDAVKAVAACKHATQQAPKDGRAWFQYGRALEKSGNIPDAVKAYETGARLGNAGAINNLGELDLNGKTGVHLFDSAQKRFKLAADKGYPESTANLEEMKKRHLFDTGAQIPARYRGRYTQGEGEKCSQTLEISKGFGGTYMGYVISARTIGREQDESCSVLEYQDSGNGLGTVYLACFQNEEDQYPKVAVLNGTELLFHGSEKTEKIARCK